METIKLRLFYYCLIGSHSFCWKHQPGSWVITITTKDQVTSLTPAVGAPGPQSRKHLFTIESLKGGGCLLPPRKGELVTDTNTMQMTQKKPAGRFCSYHLLHESSLCLSFFGNISLFHLPYWFDSFSKHLPRLLLARHWSYSGEYDISVAIQLTGETNRTTPDIYVAKVCANQA